MPRTPDGTAATWRDLADELTAEQIIALTNAEHLGAGELLDLARHYAGQHLADMLHAGLPAPAGAAHVWHWELDGDGRWSSRFDGTARHAGGATVTLGGVQFDDGTTERSIDLDAPAGLTAPSARALAAALIEAADELDRLDG